MKNLILLTLLLIFCSNCSHNNFRSTYLSPSFEKARAYDRIVAILPFEVNNHYKKKPKGSTKESLKNEEKHDAYIMQRDLYRYCLRVLSKDRYTVNFQHVNETNKILTSKGIDYEDIENLSKVNLAEILGVDAVVSGEVHQVKSKWNLNFFVNMFKDTPSEKRKVDAKLAIHNRENKRPVWKYNDGVSNASEDTVLGLSRKLLRTVALNIPYQKDPEDRVSR